MRDRASEKLFAKVAKRSPAEIRFVFARCS